MPKVTQSKFVNLIGYTEGRGISRIPKTICWRKPASLNLAKQVKRKYKYALGMVSAHNIYRKANTSHCRGWCHCFRDPETFFPTQPTILLSESDFIDPRGVKSRPRSDQPKWDFFYFTIGGNLGSKYKGMDLFAQCLPILCGEFGMKGVLIKYAKANRPFSLNKTERRYMKQFGRKLQIYTGKLNPRRMSSIMAKSRFGFFPNRLDCSPLMITESIVRDCPVLVNKQILGGWKYVDSEDNGMGLRFRKKTLKKALESMLEGKFTPRESFMKEYGYKKTAIRLADFCREHISTCKNYKMVAFAGTEKLMEHYAKEI